MQVIDSINKNRGTGTDPDSKLVPDPFLNLGSVPGARWVPVPEPCSISKKRIITRNFLGLSARKVLKLGRAGEL